MLTKNCNNCADGKKVIVNINPGKNIFLQKCKYIDNKFQVITQSKCVVELLGSLVKLMGQRFESYQN